MKQLMRSLFAFFYFKLAKPVLFKILPDSVHENLVRFGIFMQKLPFFNRLLHAMFAHQNNSLLEQKLFGLKFTNPIGLSAGFDKNAQLVPTMRAVGFGFATVGSITAEAAPGNPRPWYYRLPKSQSIVVNAGLPNHGAAIIDTRISGYQSELFEHLPLVASVAKTNSPKTSTDKQGVADYIAAFKVLQYNPRIAMFEVNISCPNTYGGEPFTRPEPLEDLLSKLDALELLQPVTIKMPINLDWEEFEALLKVITNHNVVAVTIGNLQKNRKAVILQDALPDAVPGNLSGKPTHDMSNNLISRTFAAYGDKLTVIGVGGVFNADDAYKKIKLGSSLVEIITGVIFGGPQIVGQINHDLARLLKRDGYSNVSQAIGIDVPAEK